MLHKAFDLACKAITLATGIANLVAAVLNMWQ